MLTRPDNEQTLGEEIIEGLEDLRARMKAVVEAGKARTAAEAFAELDREFDCDEPS